MKQTLCDFCSEATALIYCQPDTARLCLRCDRHVHTANTVSSRHHRGLLCDMCQNSPAAFLSSHGALCTNCDFDGNYGTGGGDFDRRPVELFTGCPSVVNLAALLGVQLDEKIENADDGGGGWPFPEDMWVWETEPVTSMQDLIVPTTSNHGFQATGMPPLPKNRNSGCGKQRDEIVKQLNELIKVEGDDGGDGEKQERGVELQFLLPEPDCGEGDLRSHLETDLRGLVVPGSEGHDIGWNCNDFQERSDSVLFSYEQLTGNSALANASFPDGHTDDHPNTSHVNIDDQGGLSYPVIEENKPSLTPKGCYELCANRESVISRYKQKRKTRRYDKQIRYESRKARADTRLRIKGRFAKVNKATDS